MIKDNKIILDNIYKLTTIIKNCTIIQATTELQYLDVIFNFLKTDSYLKEKKNNLKIIQSFNKPVIELVIASAISKHRNSNSGIDLFIKNKIKSNNKFLLIPNLPIKLQTCNEIAICVLNEIKNPNIQKKIYPKSYIIFLDIIIKVLKPNTKVISVNFYLIYLIALLITLISKIFSYSFIVNYEKITYHRNLKNNAKSQINKQLLLYILDFKL